MLNFIRKVSFLIFFIRFKKYGLWLFTNFIMAMIPFAVMFVQNYSEEALFSSFLSFNFGLLISSLYVLLILLDSRIETQKTPIFLIVFTIFWLISINAAYVLYPDIPNKMVLQILTKHIKVIAAIILGVTVLISLFLNKPNIERSINEKRATQIMDESQDIKDSFKSISRELEMDGAL